EFPPNAPSENQICSIISGFVKDTAYSNLHELGCTICGCLTQMIELTPIAEAKLDLSPLF
ncbi:hypothetical protein BC835DRAFT_1234174, partial [Cytidiella melzeri]